MSENNNIICYNIIKIAMQVQFSFELGLLYNKQNKIVIKDILVSTGAKLIIPVCESIFRMPGLPKIPNAQK